MAIIKAELLQHPYAHIAEIWKWPGVTEADTCTPINVPHKPDETVQVVGNFGAGGQVDIEGAVPPEPDVTEYEILDDMFGTPISFTAAAKKPVSIAPNVTNVKPVVAAGTGVLVDIYVIAK